MFCIMQGLFFGGGVSKIEQAPSSMLANPTELCALLCISGERRGGRGGGGGGFTHAVTLSKPRAALIFFFFLTEVADQATVQQPPRADRKPHVCCDVFSVRFSNLFDAETLPRQEGG